MLKLCGRTFTHIVKDISSSEAKYVQSLLSTSELSLVKTSCRTTYILKRTYPVPLLKSYADPKKFAPRKKKFKLYEIVECTDAKREGEISIILKALVPDSDSPPEVSPFLHESPCMPEDVSLFIGLGEAGDVVTVRRSHAYNKYLLPGLAEFATEEAIKRAEEKKKNVKEEDNGERFSSLHVPRALGVLSRLIVTVTMHQENKWVLEPWHIRVSLRKAGVHVLRDDCIELPKNKIEGPNLNNEGKEFLVTVILNKKEKVDVRCRLHHWHPDIMKRPTSVPLFWTKRVEPIFAEDTEKLLSMPLPPIPKDAVIKT